MKYKRKLQSVPYKALVAMNITIVLTLAAAFGAGIAECYIPPHPGASSFCAVTFDRTGAFFIRDEVLAGSIVLAAFLSAAAGVATALAAALGLTAMRWWRGYYY